MKRLLHQLLLIAKENRCHAANREDDLGLAAVFFFVGVNRGQYVKKLLPADALSMRFVLRYDEVGHRTLKGGCI